MSGRAKRPLPPVPLSATDARYKRIGARRQGPTLTAHELSWVRVSVAEVIMRRTRTGEPVPTDLRNVLARVTDLLAIDAAGVGSGSGTESCCYETELDEPDEMIDTATAAAMLSVSPEYVRRIARNSPTVLDGKLIGGRWTFPRRSVTAYAEGRNS